VAIEELEERAIAIASLPLSARLATNVGPQLVRADSRGRLTSQQFSFLRF
jgi:hypothetical protein